MDKDIFYPKSESRVSPPNVIFIPPEERFPHTEFTDFRAHIINAAAAQIRNAAADSRIAPSITKTETAFETFEQIDQLYVPKAAEDSSTLKFVRAQVYAANERAWKTDLEFARQMLAGLNPMAIQCLQTFPASSSLYPNIYCPQESSITYQHIEKLLGDLSVEKAVASKRFFILDYYDAYMLYA